MDNKLYNKNIIDNKINNYASMASSNLPKSFNKTPLLDFI